VDANRGWVIAMKHRNPYGVLARHYSERVLVLDTDDCELGMGYRYRKSVKLGPFRATMSKSGVSYSAGVQGERVTRRANSKVLTRS
jgi:Protein of unknown function (DUF4236)